MSYEQENIDLLVAKMIDSKYQTFSNFLDNLISDKDLEDIAKSYFREECGDNFYLKPTEYLSQCGFKETDVVKMVNAPLKDMVEQVFYEQDFKFSQLILGMVGKYVSEKANNIKMSDIEDYGEKIVSNIKSHNPQTIKKLIIESKCGEELLNLEKIKDCEVFEKDLDIHIQCEDIKFIKDISMKRPFEFNVGYWTSSLLEYVFDYKLSDINSDLILNLGRKMIDDTAEEQAYEILYDFISSNDVSETQSDRKKSVLVDSGHMFSDEIQYYDLEDLLSDFEQRGYLDYEDIRFFEVDLEDIDSIEWVEQITFSW